MKDIFCKIWTKDVSTKELTEDEWVIFDKTKLHREDGPAIEWADGTEEWWFNGKRHREDGPAYEEICGTKSWWLNGKRHREDGPALEWDGNKQWYINGKKVTEEIILWVNENKIDLETEEGKLLFKIRFG